MTLKWSVCERFHEYLYGGKFQVYTDNNPLMYVLTTAKLDATGQRWVASLANYDFTIHYRSGKQNTEADALSRNHTAAPRCPCTSRPSTMTKKMSGSNPLHLLKAIWRRSKLKCWLQTFKRLKTPLLSLMRMSAYPYHIHSDSFLSFKIGGTLSVNDHFSCHQFVF